MEEYGRAEKYLRTAMEMKPDDIGYSVDYMLMLVEVRQFDKAYEIYKKYRRQGVVEEKDDPLDDGHKKRHKKEDGHNNKPFETNEKHLNLPEKYAADFNYVYLQTIFAHMLSHVGNTEEAEMVFKDLLRKAAFQHYEVHFYYAQHLYNTRRYPEACMQYIFAIILESNWSITYHHLACTLYATKQYRMSQFYVHKAHAMNNLIPSIENGFKALTAKLTRKLANVPMETEELIHENAVYAYGSRNWDTACLLFLQLLQLAPDNLNYQHNMAMVLYYGFKNVEGSEKYFKLALTSCQNSHPDILRHYCQLLTKQKRWDDSYRYYGSLVKLISRYKEQLEDAQEENGGEPIPPNPSMELTHSDHVNYGTACMETGQDTKLVEEHLAKALRMKPEDSKLLRRYAVLMREDRRFERSDKYFQRSLGVSPNDTETRYEYATLLWTTQRYGDACGELRRTLMLLSTASSNATGKSSKHSKGPDEKFILDFQEKCCILFAIILLEMQEYAECDQYLLKAIYLNEPNLKSIDGMRPIDPNKPVHVDVRYLAEYMLLKIRTRRYKVAQEIYRYACSLGKEKDWYLQCVYGLYCGAIKKSKAASELFKKLAAMEENDEAYFVHYYYGLHLHYACKDYVAAVG